MFVFRYQDFKRGSTHCLTTYSALPLDKIHDVLTEVIENFFEHVSMYYSVYKFVQSTIKRVLCVFVTDEFDTSNIFDVLPWERFGELKPIGL